VQDPRVVRVNTTHWLMTYCTFGPACNDPRGCPPNVPHNVAYRACGGGAAGLGIATTTDPSQPSKWVRHGYSQLGKSAALLVRDKPPHYAFFGIPSIAVYMSDDLLTWAKPKSWSGQNWLINDDDFSGFVEAGAPPERLSTGDYIMTYNILGPCNCWGAGYIIMDKTDPSIILQRTSIEYDFGPLIWPSLPWEVTNTSGSSWEPLKCCIGATNSLQPLGGDSFLAHYASGDSVAGSAIISVKLRTDDKQAVVSNMSKP